MAAVTGDMMPVKQQWRRTAPDAVAAVFDAVPARPRRCLLALRDEIFQVHEGIDDGRALVEALRWGAPSYLRQGGSTVRLGWSPKAPGEYRLFCHCQSSLVATFRELYPEELRVDGNRAIVFTVGAELPWETVRHCITLALRYHSLKHLPLLGG